jgi:hypothetical protein
MRLDQVPQQITSASEDLANDQDFFLFAPPYWYGGNFIGGTGNRSH